MTKRATGVAQAAPAPRKRAKHPGDDIGHMLPLLARAAADKVRARKPPFSRSEALTAAPWDAKTMPTAWERPFREAYADRLEELGVSLPAKRSGGSGTSQAEEDRAARGVGRLNLRIAQSAIDKLDRDAKRIGCSRAKLIETLILAS